VTKIIIDGDKAKIQYYLRVPPDGRTQEVEVLPIEPFGGPFGTVPELLFEKRHLISTLQQILSSTGKTDISLL
jgi:hypothetical protein